MLAKNKFVKLNVKQQVHKLAFEVRKIEAAAEAGETADMAVLEAYIGFAGETSAAAKLLAAAERSKRALTESFAAGSARERTAVWDLCYHDLLAIIDETVGEPFYRVRRFDEKRETRRFDYVIVLDNLRSAFNVGSVFRTADGFGAGKVILTGITPRPPSTKIDRASMGTTATVAWEYFPTTAGALSRLKAEGYAVYVLETSSNSIELEDVKKFERAAFVFGNEEFGVSDAAMDNCDAVVEIPLVGRKNSVNVANACAVVCYRAMVALTSK
jgi:tRNA G18 (ribose-2'-O)-methylase SpoU